EIVFQRGVPPQSTYVFKHALIQDAAYQSLLRSTRQSYHRRIAEVLVAQFPDTAETQPELLAQHFTEADLIERALDYWQQAGEKAIQRSAHAEAIAHLHQGLALLQTLPETRERVQREVDMHITLGSSLLATKGYAAPEVRETYTRARQLCEHLDNLHQMFTVLRGLWNYYQGRAEYQMAGALGEQLLALAQQAQDSAMFLAAHRTLGATLFWVGAVASAHTHFTQGIALYDLQQHRASTFLYGEDAGVVCRTLDASTLWLLGYPNQGLIQSQEALALAHQIAHPFSLGFALSNRAIFYHLRREGRAIQEHTAAVLRISPEQLSPQGQAAGA